MLIYFKLLSRINVWWPSSFFMVHTLVRSLNSLCIDLW
jgi:hypothetical protein